MKKKVLSFIFALFLVFVPSFMFVACMGGEEEISPEEPPASVVDGEDGSLDIRDGVFLGWGGNSDECPEEIIIPNDVEAIYSTLFLGRTAKKLVIPASVTNVVAMGDNGNYEPVLPTNLYIDCNGGTLDNITVEEGSSLFVADCHGLYSLGGYLLYLFNTKNMTEFTVDTDKVSDNIPLDDLDFSGLRKLTVTGSAVGNFIYISSLTSLEELVVNNADCSDFSLNTPNLIKLSINDSRSNYAIISVDSYNFNTVNLGSNLNNVTITSRYGGAINVNATSSVSWLQLDGGYFDVTFDYSQVAFEFGAKYQMFGYYQNEWENLGFGMNANEENYYINYDSATIKLNFASTTAEERGAVELLKNFGYETKSAEWSQSGEPEIELFSYSGDDTTLVIPQEVLGYKVTKLALYNHNIKNLTLPSTLTYFETDKDKAFTSITFGGTKKQLEGVGNAGIFKHIVSRVSCSDGDYNLTLKNPENSVYTYYNNGNKVELKVDWQNNAIEVSYNGYTTHGISSTQWDEYSSEYLSFSNGSGVGVKFAYSGPMELEIAPVIYFDLYDSDNAIKASSSSVFTGTISHNYTLTFSEPSTCRVHGFDRYTCDVCSDWYDNDLGLLPHSVDKYGICQNSDCEESTYFYFSDEGNYYSVFVKSDAQLQAKLYIPSEYNGKPVKEIESIFRNETQRETVTDIVLPKNLSKFSRPFDTSYEYELQNIWYEGSAEDWLNITFGGCETNPLCIADNLYVNSSEDTSLKGTLLAGEFAFKEGTTTIPNYSFYNYKKLTTVTIPSSVTTLGEQTFANNTSITTLNFYPVTVSQYSTVGNYYYKTSELIGKLFDGVNSIENVTCDASKAWCMPTSLKNLYICSNKNERVLDIDYSNYSNLTTLTFGNYITEIDTYDDASDATKLTNIYFLGSLLDWFAIDFGDSNSCANPIGSYSLGLNKKFYVGESLDKMTLVEGEVDLSKATTIHKYALRGYDRITKFIAPKTITDMYYSTLFSDTTALREVHALSKHLKDMPSCVEKVVFLDDEVTIGDKSGIAKDDLDDGYDRNSNITTLEGNIVSIGEYGLAGYRKLANIDLSNVTKLGAYALAMTNVSNFDLSKTSNCSYLAFYGLEIENLKCKSGAFYQIACDHTDTLKNIEIVDGSEFNAKSLELTKLTSLTLPKSVTTIYSLNAPNLSEVHFGGSIDNWCSATFQYETVNYKQVFTFFASGTKLFVDGGQNYVTELATSKITSINAYAFQNYSYLQSITSLAGITTIGDYAFNNCTNLATLQFVSIRTVGNYAFNGCSLLENVTISSSMETIGDYAFNGCEKISGLNFSPSNLKSIGAYAFAGCEEITEFIAPNTLVFISATAFGDTNQIATARIPSSALDLLNKQIVEELTIFGCEGANENVSVEGFSKLTEVTFTNVLSLGIGKCPELLEIKIDDTLTTLNYFVGLDKLNKMKLPATFNKSTATIPTSLKEFEYWGTITDWLGVDFTSASCNPTYVTKKLYVNVEGYANPLTSLVIPEGVTQIKDYAFVNCELLTSIDLGGVTNIGTCAFSNSGVHNFTIPETVRIIGTRAFENCTNLTQVTIPLTTDASDKAFMGCEKISSLTMSKLTSTRSGRSSNVKDLFYDPTKTPTSFALIFASDSITEIPAYAFEGLNITSITFPETCKVSTIGEKAFYQTKLKSVKFGDLTSIGIRAFAECRDLTSVTIGQITTLGDYAFAETGITELTLKVTNLGSQVCYNCNALEVLTLVGTLSSGSIGNGAKVVDLTGCTTATVGNANLFKDMTTLTRVRISSARPNNNEIDYKNAFNTTATKGIIIDYQGDLSSWASQNFLDAKENPLYMGNKLYINGKDVFTTTQELSGIGGYAFYGCTNIKNIKLMGGYIYNYAFSHSGLEKVTYEESSTSYREIGKEAFSYCTNLVELHVPDTSEIESSIIRASSSIRILDLPYLGKTRASALVLSADNEGAVYMPYLVSDTTANTDDASKSFVSLQDLTIRYGVIKAGAFKNFQYLQTVTLGDPSNDPGAKNVLVCGSGYNGAFYNCPNLYRVNIFEVKFESSEVTRGFYECPKLVEVEYYEGSTPLADLQSMTAFKNVIHFMETASDETTYISTDKDGFVWYNDATSKTLEGAHLLGLSASFVLDGDTLELPKQFDDFKSYTIYKNAFYDFGREGVNTLKLEPNDGVTVSIMESAFNLSSFETFILKNITHIGKNALSDTKAKTITLYQADSSGVSVDEGAFYLNRYLTNLTLRGTFTNIAKNMFKGCGNLTTLSFTASKFDTIGESAFSNCSSLTTMSTLGEVTTIGDYAFEYCRSLTKIPVTKAEKICQWAFSNCSGLTEFTIDGTKDIDSSAFAYCNNLRSVTLTNSAYTVLDNAIVDSEYNLICGFVNTTIGLQIKSIADYAFYGLAIESITIPGNVKSIGQQAFRYSGLQSITISEGVETIGERVFQNCEKLKSIVIPSSVTSLGSSAFLLSGLEVAEIKGSFALLDETFSMCYSLESVTLGDKISEIGNNAFKDCTSLSQINLSEGLTKIGSYAFDNCTSLVTVVVPYSVTTINQYAFRGCTNIINLTVPFVGLEEYQTSTKVEEKYKLAYIFDNKNVPSTLKNLTITKSGYLWINALENLNLDTLTFGEKITSVFAGSDAFKKTEVNKVYISNISTWLKSSFREGGQPLSSGTTELYAGGQLVTSVDTSILDGEVAELSGYLFHNYSHLETLTIGKATSVGKYAFYNTTNLTTVTGAQNLTEVKEYAFAKSNFENSSDLVINATKVLDHAFSEISGIKKLTLAPAESATQTISQYAFSGCTGIDTLNLSPDTTYGGSGIFGGLTSLITLTLPEGLTECANSMFEKCENLTTVIVPSSMVSFGYSVFSGCGKLSAVKYAGTLYEWATSITFKSNASQNAKNLYGYATIRANYSSNPLAFGATLYTKEEGSDDYVAQKEIKISSLEGKTTLTIKAYSFAGSSITSVEIAPLNISVYLHVGEGAFALCESLETVTIKDFQQQTTTNNLANRIIGDTAFLLCKNLKEITINTVASNAKLFAKDGVLYEIYKYSEKYVIKIVTTYGNNVAIDNDKIAEYELYEIGDYAFWNSTEQEITVTLPMDKLYKIGENALWRCENLKIEISGTLFSGSSLYWGYWPSNKVLEAIAYETITVVTAEVLREKLITYEYGYMYLES